MCVLRGVFPDVITVVNTWWPCLLQPSFPKMHMQNIGFKNSVHSRQFAREKPTQSKSPHKVTRRKLWTSATTSVRAEAVASGRDSSGSQRRKSSFQPPADWTQPQISPHSQSLGAVMKCHKKLMFVCYCPVSKTPGCPYTWILHGLHRHSCCQDKSQPGSISTHPSLSPC